MSILGLPLVLTKAFFDVGLGTAAAFSLSKDAARTTVRAGIERRVAAVAFERLAGC
jgi:hypothetical protein